LVLYGCLGFLYWFLLWFLLFFLLLDWFFLFLFLLFVVISFSFVIFLLIIPFVVVILLLVIVFIISIFPIVFVIDFLLLCWLLTTLAPSVRLSFFPVLLSWLFLGLLIQLLFLLALCFDHILNVLLGFFIVYLLPVFVVVKVLLAIHFLTVVVLVILLLVIPSPVLFVGRFLTVPVKAILASCLILRVVLILCLLRLGCLEWLLSLHLLLRLHLLGGGLLHLPGELGSLAPEFKTDGFRVLLQLLLGGLVVEVVLCPAAASFAIASAPTGLLVSGLALMLLLRLEIPALEELVSTPHKDFIWHLEENTHFEEVVVDQWVVGEMLVDFEGFFSLLNAEIHSDFVGIGERLILDVCGVEFTQKQTELHLELLIKCW